MKSSECAAWNCNRAIGLFSHFAGRVCSKYCQWCIQITVKTKISSHCAPPVVHSNRSQNEDQQPLCATAQLRMALI
jgi:hypothetical protein